LFYNTKISDNIAESGKVPRMLAAFPRWMAREILSKRNLFDFESPDSAISKQYFNFAILYDSVEYTPGWSSQDFQEKFQSRIFGWLRFNWFTPERFRTVSRKIWNIGILFFRWALRKEVDQFYFLNKTFSNHFHFPPLSVSACWHHL
jgi:hypothetical protein